MRFRKVRNNGFLLLGLFGLILTLGAKNQAEKKTGKPTRKLSPYVKPAPGVEAFGLTADFGRYQVYLKPDGEGIVLTQGSKILFWEVPLKNGTLWAGTEICVKAGQSSDLLL